MIKMNFDSKDNSRLKGRSPAFKAIFRMMRPLAKLMLHQGLPATESIEALKVAFVAAAEEDFAIPGKKNSHARVSVLTGFDRNTVADIRAGRGARSEHYYNRAERCARAWYEDEAWQHNNKPMELPFSSEADEPSIELLVKGYSGGIGPYPILDEMLRAGMVSKLDNGYLRLEKPGYEKKLGIGPEGKPVIQVIGEQLESMINIMAFNVVQTDKSKRRLQQMLSYKNVSEEESEQLNEIVKDITRYAIEKMTEWDDSRKPTGPIAEGTSIIEEKRKTGVSINFFDDTQKQ